MHRSIARYVKTVRTHGKWCAVAISIALVTLAVAVVDLPSDATFHPISSNEVRRQFGFPREGKPIYIYAVGEEFHWSFRYPGADGTIETDDDIITDDQLCLPTDFDIVLVLNSNDYLYFLTCPTMDLREIAMRGLTHQLRFRSSSESEGKHPLITDPMCGYRANHDDQMGSIKIMNEDDFGRWGNSILNQTKTALHRVSKI